MPVLDKHINLPVPRAEAFQFWRAFDQFPATLSVVRAVEVLSETRSRWTVEAPLGTTVGFEAELVEESPGEYIRWRSNHGTGTGGVESGGEVFFEPLDGGHTHVHVRFRYELRTPEATHIANVLGALGYPSKAFDESLAEIQARFVAAED